MEAIRLFILKIILAAIIMNAVTANNTPYKTISLVGTNLDKSPPNSFYPKTRRRNWSEKSNIDMYKNMPPYLVFNKKTGSYFPYFKYPNIRRVGSQATGRQWRN